MTENKEHPFFTQHYSGVWFPFHGDRLLLRTQIQSFLRENLGDLEGILQVSELGPFWVGKDKINISYSHTDAWALLVYSPTHELGVDIERADRVFSQDPLILAERFFHPSEYSQLKCLPNTRLNEAFLTLWTQKEAFAKMTRKGLSQTLSLPLAKQGHCEIQKVAKVKTGYIAHLSIQSREH